ncbi:hypothetical protein F4808DRAFT_457747 [Astrocystis sublimbata]|nr:hypothetical protein F4808DRAFT_457747 [Astrocystis sublimbata]
MQPQTYLSILIALAGIVSSAPTPVAHFDEGKTIKTREGRFRPVWVVGLDEDEEKGKHIGFRLWKDGWKTDDEEGKTSRVGYHGYPKTHEDEESALWYYY